MREYLSRPHRIGGGGDARNRGPMSAKRPFTPPTEIDRLRHGQGKMLHARDFRDQVANDAQMRWWHNRAVHDSYGVAGGLETALDGDAVTVQSGLAYDAFGRELVLRFARAVPLPTAAAGMTLVMRYRDSIGGAPASAGAWLPHRPLPRGESDLAWIPTAAVRVRDGVPLARLPGESATPLDALPASVAIAGPLGTQMAYDPATHRLTFRGLMRAAERDALRALSPDADFGAAIDALSAA